METVKPTWSMYKEKTVVVWGTGYYGENLVATMQVLGLEVTACCGTIAGKVETEFRGIPVISTEELGKYQEKTEDLVVQLAVPGLRKQEALEQLEALHISCIISFADGMTALFPPLRDHMLALYPSLAEEIEHSYHRNLRSYAHWEQVTSVETKESEPLLMLPAKTGDHTLMATCRKHDIPFVFGRHAVLFVGQGEEKRNVITAIRDPISRDISDIFQTISNDTLRFLTLSSQEEVESFICEKSVQAFFDDYVKKQYTFCETDPKTIYTEFFDTFGRNITDLTQKPFDTEKGCTILNTETANVFIYQLEQLNQVIEPLSQWLGTPFTELENDNAASDKWVAPYYQLAKKELVLSKEYVDAAYNDPYVKHFYSKEQIETMKSKWLGNIKTP